MIIKLSHAEIKGFVATSLNLNPSRFDIEIEPLPAPVRLDPRLLIAFRAAIREFPAYASYQKIPAIKRFRELAPRQVDRDGYVSCGIGLADAKWAVENAGLTLLNLEHTGSIRG